MTLHIRALLAALIVVAVAAGGAIFIGYRTGIIAAQSGIDVATTGDIASLLSENDPSGTHLVNRALRTLESTYYKPIDPQTPLAGETDGLRAYLKAKKVANPALPSENATGDQLQDGVRASDLLAYAQQHYASSLGANGETELTDAALTGMLNSVKDPYTVYLMPREFQGLDESLTGGNFGGIGVYIYQLRDGRVIIQPIEAMPAARAGMKPGQIIDTVDGKAVRGLTLDRVERMIRGEAGSTVRITAHPYNKPSQEQTYAIVRETIRVPTVRQKMEDGFDYIRLSDFGQTSGDEVRKALLEGQAKGAKGYILDLRDNGGGYLDAAVQVSSLFIPQGTIVSTIRRDGQRTTEEALGNAIPGLHPVVILVNRFTASASEITSGALQDYHLATLIGTRTFGKGVVQTIFPLPGQEGALKITTARYVTPAGRDIQHKGIEPDIVVQQPDSAIFDTPADRQLAAAKARLESLSR